MSSPCSRVCRSPTTSSTTPSLLVSSMMERDPLNTSATWANTVPQRRRAGRRGGCRSCLDRRRHGPPAARIVPVGSMPELLGAQPGRDDEVARRESRRHSVSPVRKRSQACIVSAPSGSACPMKACVGRCSSAGPAFAHEMPPVLGRATAVPRRRPSPGQRWGPKPSGLVAIKGLGRENQPGDRGRVPHRRRGHAHRVDDARPRSGR